MSEDGRRAIIDVMQALRTRLTHLPKDHMLEDRQIAIQFCGKAVSCHIDVACCHIVCFHCLLFVVDGSTAFKLGHEGTVLAIQKINVDEGGLRWIFDGRVVC